MTITLSKKAKSEQTVDFSKKLLMDTRGLLWLVSVGGLALAFYAIHEGFTGALAWITALVGLPWASHATAYAFYTSMAKSDHREGGITYETAKAQNFGLESGSVNSPAI